MEYLVLMVRDFAFGIAVAFLLVSALRAIPAMRGRPTLAVWLSLPFAWLAILFIHDKIGFDAQRDTRVTIIGAAVVLLWLKRKP